MTWWETVPTLLVAIAIGIIPGLLLAIILGLRGVALVGSAPVFTVTSIALASIVAPKVGLDWGLLPVALTTAVLAAIIGALRYLWHRMRPHPPIPQDSPRVVSWSAIGIAFAAIVIGLRFMVIFNDPENISQTYDNIFHLNALRYVLETDNASSLTLGGLTANEPGTGSFYPAVWHAITTLVIQTTGVSIPVAVNLIAILMGAIYWPLGCVFLIRQIVGPRAVAMVAAGALAAAFGIFPYMMVDFGVLYPYLLGLSLLPAALAYVIESFRIGVRPTMRPSRARLALLGVLPGLALAHPSVVMSLFALCVPILLVVIHREYQRLRLENAPRRHFVVLASISVAIFTVLAVLWLALRVHVAWEPKLTLAQAIGETLTNAPVDLPVAWVVSILMLIGIWLIVRQRAHYWVFYVFLMAAFLHVVAAGVPHSLFRSGVVGIWYGDTYRLAALLPVAVLPLAVMGFVKVYDLILTRVRSRPGATEAKSNAVSFLVVAVVLLASQGVSVQAATLEAMESYVADEDSRLLTADELDVLHHVDDYVPEDVVVAGNPWTGASLVYALADREAMLPHVGGFDSAESDLIAERLRFAGKEAEVCEAIDTLRVGYALDFGYREIHGGEHDFSGFNNLFSSPAVELVYESGRAGLYKITACD